MVIFRFFFCINIGSHLGFLTALGDPEVDKCGSWWILLGDLPKNICANFHAFTRFCTPQTSRSIAFKFLCLTLHMTYLQKGAITPLVFVQLCCDLTYFIKISYEMTFWLENSYTFSIFENIHCPFMKKVKIQNFSKFSKNFKKSNF